MSAVEPVGNNSLPRTRTVDSVLKSVGKGAVSHFDIGNSAGQCIQGRGEDALLTDNGIAV
jgi:hypothetical protein